VGDLPATASAMLCEESSMSKTRTLLGSLAAGALVASLALPAVAQSDAPIPIEGAEGQTWQLVEQSIDGTMTAVPDGVLVTLQLQDGQAGGDGGCNSYTAPYTIGTSSLTFGPVISTFMFCEGPGGEVETAYFADLAAVATWANTGGSLVLGDAQGEPILTFLPAPTASTDGIEGITWLLTAQLVEGALAPLPSGPDGEPVLVSLRLLDGQSGGTGGCNAYFADYTLDGPGLVFGPIGATQMFCEGAGSEVEAAYVANLASVATWMSDGATLSLADASGATVLEYAMAPETGIVGGWAASGINNGRGGVETTEATALVTAVFAEDGTLSGFDGCNDYRTTYRLDGDAISISDAIATTRMACTSEALDAQAQQYRSALLATSTWAVGTGGSLELRDSDGALQVSFTPAAG
jgi:heat shock protein HslJ